MSHADHCDKHARSNALPAGTQGKGLHPVEQWEPAVDGETAAAGQQVADAVQQQQRQRPTLQRPSLQ